MVVPLPSDDVESIARNQWPRCSYLELGAFASAVLCARKHARLVVGEWGLAGLDETVELVTSEMVTNALHASLEVTQSRYRGRWTPGVPPIRMWLCSDYQRVLIQVWDGSDLRPTSQQTGTEAESGRGLWLVEMLSEDWGTYVPADATGKVVWTVVRATD
jgi:hypothetical protein